MLVSGMGSPPEKGWEPLLYSNTYRQVLLVITWHQMVTWCAMYQWETTLPCNLMWCDSAQKGNHMRPLTSTAWGGYRGLFFKMVLIERGF